MELQKPNWEVLSEEEMRKLRAFLNEERAAGRFVVLDGVADEMRQDWLNEDLPMPDRAIRNISISSDDFRRYANEASLRVAKHVLESFADNEIYVVYPWRAAIAFIPAFRELGVAEHCHIGMKRNDDNPDQSDIYFPLDKEAFARRGDRRVVVADPMLATGGSMRSIIEEVVAQGVSPKEITLVCLVSAPEGAAMLLRAFPGIQIVAAALDGRLNEYAYIVDRGLGDAGDKYIEDLDIRRFVEENRECFSSDQAGALVTKVEETA